THCRECFEHEQRLSSLTPETIAFADAGNPGWDPICAASDEALRYFLPGLARLALASGPDYYFGQFLWHLAAPGRVDSFDRAQKAALSDFLDFAYASLGTEVDDRRDDLALGQIYDLLAAI